MAVTLTFPNGLVYTPGEKQRITITVQDPAEIYYGFEVSARLNSNMTNGQAGDLAPADSTAAYTECNGAINQDFLYLPPCPEGKSVQFIKHAMPSTTGIWQIDWTPPPSGSGNVTIFAAVNAGYTTFWEDKHIHLRSYSLSPADGPAPLVIGAGNGASFQLAIAPEAWFTVIGTNLSSASGRKWTQADFVGGHLPRSMDGASVTVNGKNAYLEYVSPTQLNVIAPADSGPEGLVGLIVTWNGV